MVHVRIEIKGCIFARSGKVYNQFFNHFVFKMAAANAHHRCGAVNLRSKQSRFYLYLWCEYMHNQRKGQKVVFFCFVLFFLINFFKFYFLFVCLFVGLFVCFTQKGESLKGYTGVLSSLLRKEVKMTLQTMLMQLHDSEKVSIDNLQTWQSQIKCIHWI